MNSVLEVIYIEVSEEMAYSLQATRAHTRTGNILNYPMTFQLLLKHHRPHQLHVSGA